MASFVNQIHTDEYCLECANSLGDVGIHNVKENKV